MGTVARVPEPVAAPGASLRREGRTLHVTVAGAWMLEAPAPQFPALLAAADAQAVDTAARVAFDATALGAWDSSLLIFLLQVRDACDARGIEWDGTGLPDRVARLLALARAVPERVPEAAAPAVSRPARLGTAALHLWDAALEMVTFTGAVAQSCARLLLRRSRMQWRQFWVVVQSNASGALPIVTLIALLVGVIIAFLGVVVLKRFGAGYYVSYLVGYGMLREMGALMTGIIMAGRTGAGFAAELGSMKISEEIDAYTTLGISPIDHLVLPRMLGLCVMMPLLVIYADFVGIAGGLIVAVTLLDLTPTQFMGGLLSAVTFSDAALGVFKASIFGVIIGLAGCMKGLQTGSDASAVGRAATSAVVMGITLIIVANAVVDWLAALLQI
jgi:phospholipid/cholesterol/gamma-HCH transport system permease protein